ncbi:hypothetical protein ACU8NH_09405 [Rhizobium leguminosarum]
MMLMEVQATGAVAVELPYRKRRVYTAEWKFKIGQAVKLGDLPAIVLSRNRSAMGVEIYRIWIGGNAYGRPMRTVAGSALQ